MLVNKPLKMRLIKYFLNKQGTLCLSEVHAGNPTWRINIKHEQRRGESYHAVPTGYNQRSTETILGEKQQHILVRQLWMGGIPQNFDKMYMQGIMSNFGMVEDVEIFPKFAFIKFKMVEQATIAFERADQICQMLGSPPGFRIFFSDPSRRKHIVSNHYQFQRHSHFLPILFIGFHPITSAQIDLPHIQSICDRFGLITNSYMRKNTNTQNRSYFLFTYDCLKTALKAKSQLSKRRDLLGDKRVEVTLLLEQQSIIKNRDLSYTTRMYQGQLGERKLQPQTAFRPYPPSAYSYPPPPMYPAYYPPPYYPYPEPQHSQRPMDNIHDMLKDVLKDKHQSKPSKAYQGDQSDILRKLLGEGKPKEEREPSWSGFLTWRGIRRVGVDGHCETGGEPQEYAINIINLIEPANVVIRDASLMVVSPTNSMNEASFKEYVKNLRTRVGVSMTSTQLMYIMAKSAHADKIDKIKDNQLLVVIEKSTIIPAIRDKLIKCEDME